MRMTAMFWGLYGADVAAHACLATSGQQPRAGGELEGLK
jgi:hypothetical protein